MPGVDVGGAEDTGELAGADHDDRPAGLVVGIVDPVAQVERGVRVGGVAGVIVEVVNGDAEVVREALGLVVGGLDKLMLAVGVDGGDVVEAAREDSGGCGREGDEAEGPGEAMVMVLWRGDKGS